MSKNQKMAAFMCMIALAIMLIACLYVYETRRVKETGHTAQTMMHSSKAPKGARREVAYGKEGAMDPYIVLIRPLPSGDHELIAKPEKVDDKSVE